MITEQPNLKRKYFSKQTKNKTTSDKISDYKHPNQKMKKTILPLLACAGFVSISNAAPVTWQSGDILLGFHALNTPNSYDLVFDLGNNSAIQSFSSMDISTSMTDVFGSGWATRTDIYWAAAGGASGNKNIVMSQAFDASHATPWVSLGNGNSSVGGSVANAGTRYNSDVASSNFIGNGVKEATSDSTQLWEGYLNNSFGFTGSLNSGTIETLIDTGLDIYALGTVRNGQGTLLNSIAIQGGNIVAIPEPSTYALLGFGALLLVIAYRRKNA